nr:MAG TPA: hypothetical protein [Bacteriophage sp.]
MHLFDLLLNFYNKYQNHLKPFLIQKDYFHWTSRFSLKLVLSYYQSFYQ